MPDYSSAKQYAPATERNREPIWQVLQEVLPIKGSIFEISSGTGEHAFHFAPRAYPRQWIPSDPNPIARDSITAWREDCLTDNLAYPLDIDIREPRNAIEALKGENIGAIVNINMIHIAPWEACLGLMAAARHILPKNGILYLYGPYKQGGQHTAPSNEAFDASLRLQNPEWGVRDLETVVALAETEGLVLVKTVAMPANNLSVIFQKID